MSAAQTRPRTPAKTALIGAGGRMGAMLCARASTAGLAVAGADQPLAPETLAAACADVDLALICVPAAVFEEVVRLVEPHLPPTAVLADITSVKEQPLRQMEKLWPGAVVGTHVGPGAAGLAFFVKE